MKHRILFLQILNKCCLLFYICRRSPISIAAAVIYIVTQLSNEKKALKGQKIVIHISLWLSIGNINVLWLQISHLLLEWLKEQSRILIRIFILISHG